MKVLQKLQIAQNGIHSLAVLLGCSKIIPSYNRKWLRHELKCNRIHNHNGIEVNATFKILQQYV